MNAITHIPPRASSRPLTEMLSYDARDLVKDGVQACIVLDNQAYYLRITRAGKLILTK